LLLFVKKKKKSPRQAIERNELKKFYDKLNTYFNVSHMPWVEAPTAAKIISFTIMDPSVSGVKPRRQRYN
jgi:hypothetical protein